MPSPNTLTASLALLLAARAAAQGPAPWPAATDDAVTTAPAAFEDLGLLQVRPRAQARTRGCWDVDRGKCPHPVRVAEDGYTIVTRGGAPRDVQRPSRSCEYRENRYCQGCGLFRCTFTCLWSYGPNRILQEWCRTRDGKVMPVQGARGVESVTKRSARKYDFLWAKARDLDSCKKDGHKNCAMLINPATCGRNYCYRSQHQMHIHAKQLSGSQARPWVEAISRAVCNRGSGWKTVKAPRGARVCNTRWTEVKAERYDKLDIFAECLRSGDLNNLREWGVVVLVKSKCGQIVVMNKGCSFEKELMR